MADGARASHPYEVASNLVERYNQGSDDCVIGGLAHQDDAAGNRAAVLESEGDRVTWTYDATNQLTSEQSSGASGYDTAFVYDAANRVTELTSLLDGTADYTYDGTDQLTGADYTYQGNEAYGYDANGNRTMTGYATGDNNLVLSDGVYDYQYDAEGNRTRRTHIASGEVTDYDWDHRNRLTRVTVKSSDQGPVTQDILYGYDLVFPFNQRFQPRVQLSRSSAAASMTDQFVHPKRADAASPEADRRRELYNT